MIHAPRFRLASQWLAAFGFLWTAAASLAAAEPPLLDEFRTSVREWTAEAGSVIFSSESSEESRGVARTTFGFDPATGAWFSASQSSAAGRTPDGVAYSGSPDGVTPNEDQELRLPAQMGGRIPMALPLLLLETTDGLVGITKDGDTNWVIEYLGFAPEGVERPHAQMVVSPEGRPLRFEMDARPASSREAIAYNYEFVPGAKEPLLITVAQPPASPRFAGRNIVEVQYFETSRPELFTTEAVLALAVDNRMRTQMRRNALAAQVSDSSQRAEPAGPASYVDHRLSRAGWPLIVTGVVVVGLGLVALWRTRAGR